MSADERETAERFLFREARLMDEHRYRDWLKLWAEDGVYWVPCNEEDIDPKRHVSIIYDDRERLAQRVERLASGGVLAQDPAPRMRRVLSNIEIEEEGDEVTVQSNFLLALARGEGQQLWAGRTIHLLRRDGASFAIRRKTVHLINADQEMPLLQFLI
jgi:3-phenylpropionate/cinnamic acid dioxygenase small subunit